MHKSLPPWVLRARDFSLFGVCLCLLLIVPTAHGSNLLDDPFNGSSIDSSLWSQRTVATPGGFGSITVTNGAAYLVNRGTLISKAGFSQPIDIYGSFQFTGKVASDRFVFWTRTDGTSSNPWADLDRGILFRFQQTDRNDQAKVAIDLWDYALNYNVVVGESYVPLSAGQWFDFRITDTGTNVAMYFEDLTNPILSASNVTFTGGDLIAMNNGYGGNEVAIDYVTVVPEPHTEMLLLMATLALLGRPALLRLSGIFRATSPVLRK